MNIIIISIKRCVCFNDPAWESLWVVVWVGWHSGPFKGFTIHLLTSLIFTDSFSLNMSSLVFFKLQNTVFVHFKGFFPHQCPIHYNTCPVQGPFDRRCKQTSSGGRKELISIDLGYVRLVWC